MLDNKSLIQRYNKLPEWFRWVLFITISLICLINFFRLWVFLFSVTRSIETYKSVFAIFYPAIVQVLFLILIFYTAPRDKLEMLKFFIVFLSTLRFFMLLLFLGLTLDSADFDLHILAVIIGEIGTLVASIGVYKILKKNIL